MAIKKWIESIIRSAYAPFWPELGTHAELVWRLFPTKWFVKWDALPRHQHLTPLSIQSGERTLPTPEGRAAETARRGQRTGLPEGINRKDSRSRNHGSHTRRQGSC